MGAGVEGLQEQKIEQKIKVECLQNKKVQTVMELRMREEDTSGQVCVAQVRDMG